MSRLDFADDAIARSGVYQGTASELHEIRAAMRALVEHLRALDSAQAPAQPEPEDGSAPTPTRPGQSRAPYVKIGEWFSMPVSGGEIRWRLVEGVGVDVHQRFDRPGRSDARDLRLPWAILEAILDSKEES